MPQSGQRGRSQAEPGNQRNPGKLLLALSTTLALLAAGCGQRLNIEKSGKVVGHGYYALDVDPPPSAQKVSIAISSAATLSAYLVLEKDRDKAEQNLEKDKAPADCLDQKDKAQNPTLEATIPAKSGFVIFVRSDSGKDADFQIKVTGR